MNKVVQPILETVPRDRAETLDAYVNIFEPWKMDVLWMTTIYSDPNALCKAHSDVIWLPSYIQLLSRYHGVQAATGMGPASDPRPASFQDKAYGLLSILCFFNRIAEFTACKRPCQHCVCSMSYVWDMNSTVRNRGIFAFSPSYLVCKISLNFAAVRVL